MLFPGFQGKEIRAKVAEGKFEELGASHEDFADSGVPKKFTNEIQSIVEFEADGMRTMAWKDVERPKVR